MWILSIIKLYMDAAKLTEAYFYFYFYFNLVISSGTRDIPLWLLAALITEACFLSPQLGHCSFYQTSIMPVHNSDSHHRPLSSGTAFHFWTRLHRNSCRLGFGTIGLPVHTNTVCSRPPKASTDRQKGSPPEMWKLRFWDKSKRFIH